MKIGLLGGSFDPVHLGHLAAATDAHSALALDQVWFLPAAQAPLKSLAPQAPANHRLALLQLALQPHPAFTVCQHELRQGGLNYTFDTVTHLKNTHPDHHFFWIIGADHLATLPRWHRAADLAQAIEFICLDRPGSLHLPAPDLPGLHLHRVTGQRIEVSSTSLRTLLAAGQDVSAYVPNITIEYLLQNRLYR